MTTRTWISDDNGNRCSVEYWGSREAAQRALDSLKRCSGCSDCSDCSDCSGKALEAFHDTPLAAYLIYKASSPLTVTFPRFYESNAVALADIQRMAALEAGVAVGAGTDTTAIDFRLEDLPVIAVDVNEEGG